MVYTTGRPDADDYASFYKGYVDAVTEDDFMEQLERNATLTEALMRRLQPEQWGHHYAEDKWSVKELFIHLIDTERIFAYRALRVARNDQTPLPGFEQNDYVPASNAALRTPISVINEYKAVRQATIELYRNFNDEALARRGTASGAPITVRALGFILVGHEKHHIRILRERYLTA